MAWIDARAWGSAAEHFAISERGASGSRIVVEAYARELPRHAFLGTEVLDGACRDAGLLEDACGAQGVRQPVLLKAVGNTGVSMGRLPSIPVLAPMVAAAPQQGLSNGSGCAAVRITRGPVGRCQQGHPQNTVIQPAP